MDLNTNGVHNSTLLLLSSLSCFITAERRRPVENEYIAVFRFEIRYVNIPASKGENKYFVFDGVPHRLSQTRCSLNNSSCIVNFFSSLAPILVAEKGVFTNLSRHLLQN